MGLERRSFMIFLYNYLEKYTTLCRGLLEEINEKDYKMIFLCHKIVTKEKYNEFIICRKVMWRNRYGLLMMHCIINKRDTTPNLKKE